jgi:hypothetical protein
MAEELWTRHEDARLGVSFECYYDVPSERLSRLTYSNPTDKEALLLVYPPGQSEWKYRLSANTTGATYAFQPNERPSVSGMDAGFFYPAEDYVDQRGGGGRDRSF